MKPTIKATKATIEARKAASKPAAATGKADKTSKTIKAAGEALKARGAVSVGRFNKKRLHRDPETGRLVYRLDDGRLLGFPPDVSEEDVRAAFEAADPLALSTGEQTAAILWESLESVRQFRRQARALGLKPRPPRKRRTKDEIESLDLQALALLVSHPDWTQERIAKELGISRSYLQSLPKFKDAWKQEREGAKTEYLRKHTVRDRQGRQRPRM